MFLNAQGKLTKNCPSCGKEFKKSQRPNCLVSCSAEKLAKKHQQILGKMLVYCLPKQKISIQCPANLSAEFIKTHGWGWTNDIAKIITIPWWTLRSKQEFFDTVIHEANHIIAYQKKFTLRLRRILQTWYKLEVTYETMPNPKNYQKLAKYIWQHEKEIEYYLTESEKNQGGHWYQEWYLEYKRLFEKLLKSPYAKYAYGNIQPRVYDFGENKK